MDIPTCRNARVFEHTNKYVSLAPLPSSITPKVTPTGAPIVAPSSSSTSVKKAETLNIYEKYNVDITKLSTKGVEQTPMSATGHALFEAKPAGVYINGKFCRC